MQDQVTKASTMESYTVWGTALDQVVQVGTMDINTVWGIVPDHVVKVGTLDNNTVRMCCACLSCKNTTMDSDKIIARQPQPMKALD